jgi:hypothetical protein
VALHLARYAIANPAGAVAIGLANNPNYQTSLVDGLIYVSNATLIESALGRDASAEALIELLPEPWLQTLAPLSENFFHFLKSSRRLVAAAIDDRRAEKRARKEAAAKKTNHDR